MGLIPPPCILSLSVILFMDEDLIDLGYDLGDLTDLQTPLHFSESLTTYLNVKSIDPVPHYQDTR